MVVVGLTLVVVLLVVLVVGFGDGWGMGIEVVVPVVDDVEMEDVVEIEDVNAVVDTCETVEVVFTFVAGSTDFSAPVSIHTTTISATAMIARAVLSSMKRFGAQEINTDSVHQFRGCEGWQP